MKKQKLCGKNVIDLREELQKLAQHLMNQEATFGVIPRRPDEAGAYRLIQIEAASLLHDAAFVKGLTEAEGRLSTFAIPKSHAKIFNEARKMLRDEAKRRSVRYLKSQTKIVQALQRANQELCVHPDKQSYSDPRDSGWDCPTCGACR